VPELIERAAMERRYPALPVGSLPEPGEPAQRRPVATNWWTVFTLTPAAGNVLSQHSPLDDTSCTRTAGSDASSCSGVAAGRSGRCVPLAGRPSFAFPAGPGDTTS